MKTLKAIVSEARKELIEKDKIRENAQMDMRKTTSFSKQAILLVHQKRLKEAEKLIEKATETLSKLRNTSATHPNIVYGGMYNAALQEYSEANIFLKLVQESRFVTPKEINVPSTDYVLGLADVIGECRRWALDALREGNIKKGEKCLQTMDEIYIELMAMDESYMLVAGLRRKCDVARKIIEITRGDITQEIRRNTLEKHLKLFEKFVEKKG
jgi:translin